MGVRMIFLWIVQLVVNIAFVAAAVWFQRRIKNAEQRDGVDNPAWTAAMQCLDARFKALEEASQATRQIMETETRRLRSVCDQAEAFWRRQKQSSDFISDDSSEAAELRAITEARSNDIPKLRELEKTRKTLMKDVRPDLRSVLREQLA